MVSLLTSLGMTAYDVTLHHTEPFIHVVLDGRVVGTLSYNMAAKLATQLRFMKVKGLEKVQEFTLESVHA